MRGRFKLVLEHMTLKDRLSDSQRPRVTCNPPNAQDHTSCQRDIWQLGRTLDLFIIRLCHVFTRKLSISGELGLQLDDTLAVLSLQSHDGR